MFLITPHITYNNYTHSYEVPVICNEILEAFTDQYNLNDFDEEAVDFFNETCDEVFPNIVRELRDKDDRFKHLLPSGHIEVELPCLQQLMNESTLRNIDSVYEAVLSNSVCFPLTHSKKIDIDNTFSNYQREVQVIKSEDFVL